MLRQAQHDTANTNLYERQICGTVILSLSKDLYSISISLLNSLADGADNANFRFLSDENIFENCV
ncbi:MAG TPA: hypothetical protein DIW37_15150 [Chryseobacterium sp.]|nr:hypothetical protein [Chryseobacterium sp.]